MDMTYLKDMPIAILGAGAVGKTMAADCVWPARKFACGISPASPKLTLPILRRPASLWLVRSSATSAISARVP